MISTGAGTVVILLLDGELGMLPLKINPHGLLCVPAESPEGSGFETFLVAVTKPLDQSILKKEKVNFGSLFKGTVCLTWSHSHRPSVLSVWQGVRVTI